MYERKKRMFVYWFVRYVFIPCNSQLHQTFHDGYLGPEEGRRRVSMVIGGWGWVDEISPRWFCDSYCRQTVHDTSVCTGKSRDGRQFKLNSILINSLDRPLEYLPTITFSPRLGSIIRKRDRFICKILTPTQYSLDYRTLSWTCVYSRQIKLYFKIHGFFDSD